MRRRAAAVLVPARGHGWACTRHGHWFAQQHQAACRAAPRIGGILAPQLVSSVSAPACQHAQGRVVDTVLGVPCQVCFGKKQQPPTGTRTAFGARCGSGSRPIKAAPNRNCSATRTSRGWQTRLVAPITGLLHGPPPHRAITFQTNTPACERQSSFSA